MLLCVEVVLLYTIWRGGCCLELLLPFFVPWLQRECNNGTNVIMGARCLFVHGLDLGNGALQTLCVYGSMGVCTLVFVVCMVSPGYGIFGICCVHVCSLYCIWCHFCTFLGLTINKK